MYIFYFLPSVVQYQKAWPEWCSARIDSTQNETIDARKTMGNANIFFFHIQIVIQIQVTKHVKVNGGNLRTNFSWTLPKACGKFLTTFAN